ncbi:myelin regulatory factor-like protein isoform X2 [Asterias amurensis]|uniref:myelin regulatory factor-like protein isoform X2 n=1 Tax=Asterias amurensis TaxID=7602 RepID=UPI003AB4B510
MDVFEEAEALHQFFASESPEDCNIQLDDLINDIDFNELQETLPHDGVHVHVPEVQELGPLPTATQHAQPLKNAPPVTESLTGNRAVPAKVAGVPVPVSQIGLLPESPPDSEPYSPDRNKPIPAPGPGRVVSPYLNDSSTQRLTSGFDTQLLTTGLENQLFNPNLEPPQGIMTFDPALQEILPFSYEQTTCLEDLENIPNLSGQQDDLQMVLLNETLPGALPLDQMPGGLPLDQVPGASPEGLAGGSAGIPTMGGLPLQQQAVLQFQNLPQSELQRRESILVHQNKKRKHSLSPQSSMRGNTSQPALQIEIKQEPGTVPCVPDMGCDNVLMDHEVGGDGMPYSETAYQFIKWQPYEPTRWQTLLDADGQQLTVSYRVDADKGFNFSTIDDAYVCQKKNHFQITTHVGVNGQPKYIKMDNGLKTVDSFRIHLHGIKVEAHNSYIRVEQSQANRSKRPFQPFSIDLHPGEDNKYTIGRLHYSETTSNNMRKKGKPNPDQRFFMLVVGVHAHSGDQSYVLAAHVSQRIIVRASNPGQFESDVDVVWQKGQTQDSIFHNGRIGIRTDQPEEALDVRGNIRLTGRITRPSDIRAKENVEELDPKEMRKNIEKLRMYNYNYTPEFAKYAGLPECDQVETGIIAQEVQEVLPDAVKEAGDVHLPNGDSIDNFLTVDKDRIYMENIGAVKELCRVTDNLEVRIHELENLNRRSVTLTKMNSFKSVCSSGSNRRSGRRRTQRCSDGTSVEEEHGLSLRAMHITIIILFFIMIFCICSMVGLYILNVQETSSNPTGLSTSSSSPELSRGGASEADFANTHIPITIPAGAFYPADYDYNDDDECGEPGCQFCCLASSPTTFQGSHSSPPDSSSSDTSSSADEVAPTEPQILRRREKRGNTMDNNILPTLSVSSIMVEGLNVMNSTKCMDPCGSDGNFSYNISVPPFVPLKSLWLDINTTVSTRVWKCSPLLEETCPGGEEGEPEDNEFSEGMVHRWSIPVGIYAKSTFRFRVTTSQEDGICGTSRRVGTDFFQYNLYFVRNRVCRSH